jgi:sec-independent protein translocase protein TatB
MLGLDWTELALIAVVAVVVIGPKDLPEAVRGVAKGIQKLRRMAGEFQTQVDEVVREAKLEDVRNQINEIRNFDIRSVVEKEVDKDGSLRKTFTEDPIGNPLKDAWDSSPAGTGAIVTPPPAAEPAAAPNQAAPAFVPPGVAASAPPPPPPVAAAPAPPAFVPPAAVPPAPAPSSAGPTA